MFLDASAIVAILTGEPDAGELISKIERATRPIYYSSLSAFEATVSIARITWLSQGGENKPTPAALIDDARRDVESFFEITGAKEMAIGGNLHRNALDAAQTYGRFVGHAARLNFGDCFAYACAKAYRVPLLFKGDDFSRTDIEAA